ncbi:hypothetical protein M9H77_02993 [Catharanthus roseus]|uniref:Uncharacterized protein n=1 Tax=Catharanthus roseus TaxID=4058 RepID=A0ACC0CA51_CATRO|nr:hypothetical protein M9H77_02993 [Catharanthus roseus]
MEAQIPTHYNEGTSGSSHSNLDPIKVIMQKFQLIGKDMKEIRGNITNLFVEHRDQSNIRGQVISHTQRIYGNFTPHARTFEHNSYDYYGDNRLGTRNGYNDKSYKRVPRNEVKNGGNYVKMDEKFHKEEEMLRDTMILMIVMSIAMVVRTCIMSIIIVIAMEGIIVEEVLKLWELHQDLLVTKF